MKALFILFFFSTIFGYSQSIGWTYDNSLLAIKNNVGSTYSSFEQEVNKQGTRYISANLVNNNCTSEVYYFDSQNICNQVALIYKLDHLNGLIGEMNNSYTKVSELKWKDYTKDVYYEIFKNDTFFALRMYK